MGRPRKRRVRTTHSGIKLLKRTRLTGDAWLARWSDPDTKKSCEISLTALGLNSEGARRAWAITKSKSLAERKADKASGVPQQTQTALRSAVDEFYSVKDMVLRPSSKVGLRLALEPLVVWAIERGIVLVEHLSPPLLSDFYTHVLNRPAFVSATKSPRGRKKKGQRRRSPRTINKQLILVRSFLRACRARRRTPQLSGDEAHDILALLKPGRPLIRFLRTSEVQALVAASQRHDADRWALTRAEKDGQGTPGTTAKWQPILPFVMTCLLTGMRFSEIAGLLWSEVDVEAREIVLPVERVKTGHARRIPLDVTPTLLKLLAQLKLQAAGSKFVFSTRDVEGNSVPFTRDLADTARRRLIEDYGAPSFTWHDLRRTCGTFLTCAPGVYGGASAFLSAKRLGHSVTVAEKHYAGAVTDIPATAHTLEEALGLTAFLDAQPGSQPSALVVSVA